MIIGKDVIGVLLNAISEYGSEVDCYTRWIEKEENEETRAGLQRTLEKYEESIRQIYEVLDQYTSPPEPVVETTNVEVTPEMVAFVRKIEQAADRISTTSFEATANTYAEAAQAVKEIVEKKLEGMEDFEKFAKDVRVTVSAEIDFGGSQ